MIIIKNIVIILLLSLFLLTGCATSRQEASEGFSSDHMVKTDANSDYSEKQNDLVYHDYGTGVKLSAGDELTIPNLDLGLEDTSVKIYILRYGSEQIIKSYEYQEKQLFSYQADIDGVYQIFAITDDGGRIDLTPKASIGTSASTDKNGGILPLN